MTIYCVFLVKSTPCGTKILSREEVIGYYTDIHEVRQCMANVPAERGMFVDWFELARNPLLLYRLAFSPDPCNHTDAWRYAAQARYDAKHENDAT